MKALGAISAISAVHFALTFGLLVYALGSCSEDFEGSFPGDAAAFVFELLAQPGWTLLHWIPTSQQQSIELYTFVFNSLLWGCLVYFLIVCGRVLHRDFLSTR